MLLRRRVVRVAVVVIGVEMTFALGLGVSVNEAVSRQTGDNFSVALLYAKN